MLNKNLLLNKKFKTKKILYMIFIFALLTSILLTVKIKTYDSLPLTGLITCKETCIINITLDYSKIDILNNNPKIEYLNKEYEIDNIKYNEPYLNNGIPFEDIEISSNINIKEERIINFKLLYNKQRIITKIKNIVTGE